MKIVLATGIYPPDAGGPATYTRALARVLVAEGHEVRIVCYADMVAPTSDDPCPIIRIARSWGVLRRYSAFFRAVWHEAKKADLIYAQGADAAGLPSAIAAHVVRKPLVIKMVGDYAWETYAGAGGGELLDTFLMHCHTGKIRVLESLERWVARQARQVVVPSAYLKTVVAAWGVPDRRIQVVYNAIEPLPEGASREQARQALGVQDKRVALTAVRAVPWKAGDFLISQFKTLPENTILVIAGDGPSLPSWKQVAEETGVAHRVRFLGRTSRHTLAEWYRAADLFVLASGYEGLPFAVIEAASVGLPSFVSDKGGNPETPALTHPVPVRILPYRDTAAWQAALAGPWPARGDTPASHASFAAMMQQTTEVLTQAAQPPVRTIMLSYERGFGDAESLASKRLAQFAANNMRVSAIVLPASASAGTDERGNIRVIRHTGGSLMRLWGGAAHAWREVTAARRAGEAPLLSAQDPFIAGVLAFFVSRLRHVPMELQEHADYFSGAWEREHLVHRLMAPMGRFLLRRTDHVRVVSERIRARVASFGISSQRITTVPVAIHMPMFLAHTPRPWPATPTIVAPCRFVKQKGIDMLLQSLALLKNDGMPFHLRLVGEGPQGPSLANLASTLGIRDQVTFEPWGSPEALWNDADLFVLSSHYEGWGRTIGEAMATGIPVVTTDVGCVGSFFRPGIDGLAVPPGNVQALAAAIRTQFKDAAQRTQMAARARERACTFPSASELIAKQHAAWHAAVRSSRIASHRAWKITATIVAVAAAIRFVSFLWFGDTLGSNREWGIFTLVEGWFNGNGYSFASEPGHLSAYRSPGYLFFLTAVYGLFGFANMTAQAVIQNILAVLLVYLVYRLGWRVAGSRRVGWIAAIFVALHPYTFYHYTQYYHTVLSSLLLVSLLLSLLAYERTRRWGWAAWTGVMTAALAYVQGTILVAMPFLALWLLWRGWKEWQKTVLGIALIAVVSLLLIAPWTYRNGRAFHAFVPLTTDLGLAFYKANTENYERLLMAGYPHEALEEERNPEDPAQVRYRYLPEVRALLEATGGIKDAAFWTQWHPVEPSPYAIRAGASLTEAEYNAHWMGLAREWMAAHPGDALRLAARKAIVFWTPGLHPSIKYGAAWSFGNEGVVASFARLSLITYMAILEGLAILALAVTVRRKQAALLVPLLIVMAAYTVMHMLFAPYTKYRIPLDNLTAILAAVALAAAWARIHKRT